MPFQPGRSGNPAGRPKGTSARYGATLLQRNGGRILRQLIDKAIRGDLQAIAICMDRLLPRLKAQSALVQAPFHLGDGDSLADQGREVIELAFGGVIAPDQATELMTMLTAQAGLVEFSDLLHRVEFLERAAETRPPAQSQPRTRLLPTEKSVEG